MAFPVDRDVQWPARELGLRAQRRGEEFLKSRFRRRGARQPPGDAQRQRRDGGDSDDEALAVHHRRFGSQTRGHSREIGVDRASPF